MLAALPAGTVHSGQRDEARLAKTATTTECEFHAELLLPACDIFQ